MTIIRNNRPVALVSPVRTTLAEILPRIDAVRERKGGGVLQPDETWRALVAEGRRL